MDKLIHIDDALKQIWAGEKPCSLEYFKDDGSRGRKTSCIHPTNQNQHFQKASEQTAPGSRPQNIHIKGRHLVKLMDLSTGKIFFLTIPLLIKYNGQKIQHQKAI